MNMTEGEELHVIELDQGDGWTRVRRVSEFEEGFVPTSYIEMNLYNNCWTFLMISGNVPYSIERRFISAYEFIYI